MLPKVRKLISTSFALYRAHMREFATYTAIGFAPWFAISVIRTIALLIPDANTATLTIVGIMVIVIGILGTLISMAASLALIRVIAARYRGELPRTVREELMQGASLLPTMIVASIIAAIATILGVFFFIVPGIIIGVWFMFIRQAIAIDHSSITGSLHASKRAVEGRWWGMIGRASAASIFFGIPVLTILAILEALINSFLVIDPTPSGLITRFIAAVIGYVAFAICAPLFDIAHVILYIEGKIIADTTTTSPTSSIA